MSEEITAPQNETPLASKKLCVPAMVSMISGILTWMLIFFHSLIDMSFLASIIIAPITALIALFTGANAKRKIRRSDGLLTGKKMANTGLWLGWIYILICVLIAVLVLILGAEIINGISNLLG